MESGRQSEDSFEKAFGPVPRVPRMRLDGAHTRFVKGGQNNSEVDDLRPQPLYTGDTSLLEILKEGPPADLDSLLDIYTLDDAKPCAPVKKDGENQKKSFGSLRKIFSPKLKKKRSKSNVLELSEDFGGNSNHLHGHPTPSNRLRNAHQAFSSADMDQFEKIANEYTKHGPNPYPPSLTPQTSFGDSNTPTIPSHEQELKEQKRLLRDKKESPIASLRMSRKSDMVVPDSVPSPCASTSPGISRSSTLARPELQHRVTEEHLKLTNYPPVSKEDLAQLPKDLEPTLPVSKHDSLDSRHSPVPSSILVRDFVQQGPTNKNSMDHINTWASDRRQHSFPSSVQSESQKSEVSRRHNTAPIMDTRTTPEEFLGYPLPQVNFRRNGKPKPYKPTDPMIRNLDAIAYEELYGREATIARFAPPSIIEAAIQKAEIAKAEEAKEGLGLGISTHDHAQGSAKEEEGHESPRGSIKTGIRSPVTPRSGLATPQSTDEFFDFYKTLSKTSSEGKAPTSSRSSDQPVNAERGASSALQSIREGEVANNEQQLDGDPNTNSKVFSNSVPSTPSQTSSFGNLRTSVAKINAQFGEYRPSSMWTHRLRNHHTDARQGVVRTVLRFTLSFATDHLLPPDLRLTTCNEHASVLVPAKARLRQAPKPQSSIPFEESMVYLS
ncbi:MAG: hypothetical protein Q9222_004423 [Ikaeria aurantiellina]